MRNLVIERVKNVLTITIDLSEQGEPSKSGKSIVIASTEGNKKIESLDSDNGQVIYLGVNCYKQ